MVRAMHLAAGVFVQTTPEQRKGIAIASITDGLSNTICVGESSDRDPLGAGRWACGRNVFSQNERFVNSRMGELRSMHGNGAHVLFVDGHVQYLSDAVEANVLGAICTRNGNEIEATHAID
jgi:prepilin-type processing-associated H-X9-DG protein